MKKKHLLVIFFIFHQNFPYVQRIESWHYCKEKSDVHMPPKLYLFSDDHTSKEEVYPQQRYAMWDFICKTSSSFISETDKPKKEYLKPSLYQLYKTIYHTNDPFDDLWMQTSYDESLTTNVDFRTDDIHQTPEQLEHTTNKRIEAILAYKEDPALLTEYYREVIQCHQNTIAPAYQFVYNNLDQIESPKVQEKAQIIIDIYSPHLKVRTLDKHKLHLTLFAYYDAGLIDLELLHAISEHGKKGVPSAVIYAGGKHFDNIKPLLTELGYRQYRSIRLLEEKGELLQLAKYLKVIEPTYDPDAPRPQNMVDYLLRYKKFEHEHPSLAIAIPSLILLSTGAVLGALSRLVTAVLSND